MTIIRKVLRTTRLAYRSALADRADLLLGRTHSPDFERAWRTVSPVMTWAHRPSARRLWELAATPGEGTIVEIGSFLGNSTVYLALSGGEVHAVDPHSSESLTQLSAHWTVREPGGRPARAANNGKPPATAPDDTSAHFLRNLERLGVRDRVVYHRQTSVDAARQWDGKLIKLLYVDGLHTREAVLADYHAWRPFLAHEHVVLFDDFLWAEVEDAVRQLRCDTQPKYFYVRGGQAMFSTLRLSLQVAGLV
jgi:predicted O-methyltransferase YrrM